jgi:hypothetical protein
MEGIPSPPVKAHEGEEAFDEWEALYSPRFAWAANVAKRRSINKFLDSLETIKERLTPEGILQFRLKYFGAHTGRWSGDGGVNMQNLRKEPLFRDDKGFLINEADRLKEIEKSQVDKKPLPGYVTASLDLRSIFIPRAGKKMIVSDLSQIEPRCGPGHGQSKIAGPDGRWAATMRPLPARRWLDWRRAEEGKQGPLCSCQGPSARAGLSMCLGEVHHSGSDNGRSGHHQG